MSEQQIIATVEIDLPEGKKEIKMELKKPSELEDCDEGTVVILNLKNGEKYTGIFKGMDGDEDLMLGSLSDKNRIGLKLAWVDDYFEEIITEEVSKSIKVIGVPETLGQLREMIKDYPDDISFGFFQQPMQELIEYKTSTDVTFVVFNEIFDTENIVVESKID